MRSFGNPALPVEKDSGEEGAIRERLEAWALAVRRHDLAGVAAYHADDIVYFDVAPAVQVRGLAGYLDSWPPFFGFLGDSGDFTLADLRITAGSEVAFAHAILHVSGATEAHPGAVRLTVGLRKVAGTWLVVHEHHSAPL